LLEWALTFSNATNAKFTDGTNDISGLYQLPANSSFTGDFLLAASGVNMPIDLNVSGAVTKISGDIFYEEYEQIGKQTTTRPGLKGLIQNYNVTWVSY